MFLGSTPYKSYALKQRLPQGLTPPKSLKPKLSPFVSAIASNTIRVKDAIKPPVPFDTVACNAKAITPNPDALIISNPIHNLQQNLPTPVKIKSLLEMLQGYDQEKLLIIQNGFTYGFHLGCCAFPSSKISRNHRSALEHPSVIQEFIHQGIELGRIAGPFTSPPLSNFVSSPLGVVPKSEPGKFRVIHDLSFPKHDSVNLLIPEENSKVKYDSIDVVTDLLRQFGQGALMAKTDIQDAFRIIPIHSDDYNLLGFSWDNKFYYDKCLPMGASSSCQIFECLSNSLQWIMTNKFSAAGMSHMLDDFFFIGPKDSSKCQVDLDRFLSICDISGIPIKSEKTVSPTTVLTIYGIEVDSNALVCRLPEAKLIKIRDCLQQVKCRKKITLHDLQSLIGLLNFACLVVVPGRTFLRRLIDLTCGLSKPHHYIRLNCEARADLSMWSHFIESYNGRSVILPDIWLSSDKELLFTDASGSLGFAAVLGKNWFALSWENVPDLAQSQIAIKELFPIVLALEIWGPLLANKKLLFMTDNMAIVHAINKQTCKEKGLMKLIRRLVLGALTHNILFKAKHIAGKSNTLADHLSRFKFQEAFQIAPHLHHTQTVVPKDLLVV